MVRNYEMAFLLKEGEATQEAVQRIKGYLEETKAVFIRDDNMGNRSLAYVIIKNREKFKRAYYYFVYSETDTESLPDFERKLKYDTGIIRYMILRKDN